MKTSSHLRLQALEIQREYAPPTGYRPGIDPVPERPYVTRQALGSIRYNKPWLMIYENIRPPHEVFCKVCKTESRPRGRKGLVRFLRHHRHCGLG